MAATSTVTVEVVPKVDAEAIDTIVREAVADALRRLADSLAEQPTPAPANEPRFQYIQVAGREGIIDTQRPGLWEDYGVIAGDPDGAALDEQYVRRAADAYNQQARTPDWDESEVDDWGPLPQA